MGALSARCPRITRGRRVLRALLLAGLALLPAIEVGGQMRTLDPGTKVRVRLESQTRHFIALVTELRPDTLVLVRGVTRFDATTPFAVADIAELEVSGGRRKLTVIGVGIGVIAGTIATAAYNGIVQSQCFSDCPARRSMLIGAAAGGVVLGTTFHFLEVERWFQIPLPGRQEPGR